MKVLFILFLCFLMVSTEIFGGHRRNFIRPRQNLYPSSRIRRIYVAGGTTKKPPPKKNVVSRITSPFQTTQEPIIITTLQ
ncbi:hypothetical protein HW555_005572 [Spodoptera exigua]|uniref:Uncharacterized protein n=1 Tax=Spodoptera exigua TaxID=7107 RepID=A0A835GHL9_SPOEX|nr:hypothetical protein HW555_005572 [Spodoptera exigua]